ncbi:MAG: hypothetical protein RH859_13225 [Longimicrobiales bacterium]
MTPSDQELRALAESVAQLCRPSTATRIVEEQGPRRTGREIRTRTVKQPIRREVESTGQRPALAWLLPVLVVPLSVATAIYLNIIAAVALLVVGIGAAAALPRSTETRIQIGEEEVEEEYEVEVELPPETVRREEEYLIPGSRLVSVGRLSVDLLAVPLEGRTLLLETGGRISAAPREFCTPKEGEALRATLFELEGLTDRVPCVLGADGGTVPAPELARAEGFGDSVRLRGRELALHRNYERVASLTSEWHRRSFELPIIGPKHGVWKALSPPFRAPYRARGARCAKEFFEWYYSPDGRALDRLLTASLKELALKQAALHGVRFIALEGGVSPICHELGQIFHYSAFNFYCPDCNARTQEDLLSRDYALQDGPDHEPVRYPSNSRCVYEAEGLWRCRSCGQATRHPIPVHQTLDEVLLPAYDRLMDENKNRRLDIYSHARDQEIDFENQLDREIEEVFQQNREGVETLLSDLRLCEADIEGERSAIQAFHGVMAAYGIQQSQAMRQVQERYEATLSRVAEHTHRDRQEVDALFDREQRETMSVLRQCSRASYLEQAVRDKALFSIAETNAEIARQSQVQTGHLSDIAQSSRATAAHTRSTAESSAATARHTAATAANTAEVATNTAETARHTAATATNTAEVATNTAETARHTAATAQNTKATAANTAQVATHTAATAQNTARTADGVDHGNAIRAAMAEKQGVSRHAGLLRPDRAVEAALQEGVGRVLLEDDVSRAARKEKVLR